MKLFLRWILCGLGGHKWTCKAKQGVDPEKDESFVAYSTMFCERCLCISEHSMEALYREAMRRLRIRGHDES